MPSRYSSSRSRNSMFSARCTGIVTSTSAELQRSHSQGGTTPKVLVRSRKRSLVPAQGGEARARSTRQGRRSPSPPCRVDNRCEGNLLSPCQTSVRRYRDGFAIEGTPCVERSLARCRQARERNGGSFSASECMLRSRASAGRFFSCFSDTWTTMAETGSCCVVGRALGSGQRWELRNSGGCGAGRGECEHEGPLTGCQEAYEQLTAVGAANFSDSAIRAPHWASAMASHHAGSGTMQSSSAVQCEPGTRCYKDG